jgi:S-adenosylmethionine/arginine decarboxylase-like enzyme
MESHICIHTWPEFGQLTLDIYLCNYLKDNSDKVFRLGSLFKDYFNAIVINETVVDR